MFNRIPILILLALVCARAAGAPLRNAVALKNLSGRQESHDNPSTGIPEAAKDLDFFPENAPRENYQKNRSLAFEALLSQFVVHLKVSVSRSTSIRNTRALSGANRDDQGFVLNSLIACVLH